MKHDRQRELRLPPGYGLRPIGEAGAVLVAHARHLRRIRTMSAAELQQHWAALPAWGEHIPGERAACRDRARGLGLCLE